MFSACLLSAYVHRPWHQMSSSQIQRSPWYLLNHAFALMIAYGNNINSSLWPNPQAVMTLQLIQNIIESAILNNSALNVHADRCKGVKVVLRPTVTCEKLCCTKLAAWDAVHGLCQKGIFEFTKDSCKLSTATGTGRRTNRVCQPEIGDRKSHTEDMNRLFCTCWVLCLKSMNHEQMNRQICPAIDLLWCE